MLYYILAGFALLGLMVNLSFSGGLAQPDWALSILVAILLSKRDTWYWVLPLVGLHDFLLFWSVWVCFPFVALAAGLIAYADINFAPGQHQRWVGLLLSCTPLLFAGIGLISWLLTVAFTIWLWSMLSSKREKVYVEPI